MTRASKAGNCAEMKFGRFGWKRACEWAGVLRVWASPGTNPFVAQAARVEERRRLPFRVAFWWAAWFGVAWFFAWSVDSGLGRHPYPAVTAAQTAVGLAWLWAFFAARLRLASALQSEWIKARLAPILLSRLSPDEVAARAGAPAFWLGLLVAAMGLPAWAFGLALGFFSPLDALGYALLLALAIVGFPVWSATLWEAQVNARARLKAGATPSATKRRVATTTTNAGPMSLSRAVFLSLFVVGQALVFSVQLPMMMSLGTWVAMWPYEVTHLFMRPYMYPLLLARLLVYPLPFYAASLPLALALAPFWINGLRDSHARLSASLEARSDSAEKRAARVAAIWRPIRGLWAPLLLGFLLPVAYQDGWLGAWRIGAVAMPTKAGVDASVTLSLWHGLIAMATFASSFWLRARVAKGAAVVEWPILRRQWARVAARTFGVATLVGTLAPLACGHTPFPAPFGVLAAQLALVAGMWLTLQVAIARLQSVRGVTSGFGRSALDWGVILWLVGIPFLITAVPALVTWGVVFVNPLKWPMCLASPVTLWFAPRFAQSLDSPLFYGAAVGHGMLAGALLLYTRTLKASEGKPAKAARRRRLSAATRRKLALNPQAAQEEQALQQSREETLQTVLEARQQQDAPTAKTPAPPLNTLDTDAPETAALRTITRPPLPKPNAAQERFLGRFGRLDNPLLLLEMRRAMGQIDWATNARYGAEAGAIAVVIFSIVVPAIYLLMNLLTGPTPPKGSPPTFAGMEWVFAGFTLLGLVIAVADIVQKVESLYARDRLDGALDFLWLSPMTTQEIVMGKLGPPLIKATLYMAAFWPALLTISALLSLAGDYRLWPFAVVMPIFVWAFAARGVAWLHLTGVAKTSSRFALYVAGVGLGALLLPLAVGIGYAFSLLLGDFDTADFSPLLWWALASTVACLLDCWLPLAWSLRLLERERVRR